MQDVNPNTHNHTTAILSTAEQLLSKYYDLIDEQCRSGRKQAEKVDALEVQQAPQEYVRLCLDVITETEQHIHNRKALLLPYIAQLMDKVSASHDCTACSGGCKLNHAAQRMEISVSNEILSKIISRLHLTSLPLYSETIYPNEYRLLRSYMALIENNTAELISIENNYLLPGISEAQKTINVSDD